MPSIDLEITTGDAIRFAFLMTHYRSPMDLGEPTETGYAKIEQARKSLRRLVMACEPSLSTAAPIEIIEAVSDDLNTPKAIAIMHGYRKQGKGKELFAALRFLGFFDGESSSMAELKTYPKDSVFGAAQYIGFDARHEA